MKDDVLMLLVYIWLVAGTALFLATALVIVEGVRTEPIYLGGMKVGER